MSDYILKDWNAAKIIEHMCEPSLTGISTNASRRQTYDKIMEDYALLNAGIFLTYYEDLEVK